MAVLKSRHILVKTMDAWRTYPASLGSRFPPGAKCTDDGVNFSTFTRTARQVELLLYEAADKPEPAQIIILDPDINPSYLFWHVFVHGRLLVSTIPGASMAQTSS
jgi:pullulanase/glycogen debranching enzyme